MNQKKPYDSGDPKDVAKAKRDRKFLDNRIRNAIVKMGQDPDIRYLLATFLEEARVFAPTFTPIPTQHAFNDGFRSAGLFWVQKVLLHDPTLINKLQTDEDSPLKAGTNERYDNTNDDDISGE
jgi:hypothetical protein